MMKINIAICCFLFVIITILYLLSYFRKKQIDRQKVEIAELVKNNTKLKSDLTFVLNHLEEMQQIEKENKEIKNALKGAKTDEEICSIINSVISTNNKLCNKQTKKG